MDALSLVLVLKMWYTSGSLKGVLAASHYNRSWSLHSTFSEALERLLLTRFLNEKEPYISAALKDYCLGSVSFPANEVVTKSARFLQDYKRYRDEVAKGSIGKNWPVLDDLPKSCENEIIWTTSGTSKRYRIIHMCMEGVYSILLCHEQD